jgi:GNAT superfamily N-acetyltransferase
VAEHSLTIRPAEQRDLAGLLALYRELNPADPVMDSISAEARFEAMLGHPGMQVFIGFAGSTAAASVTLVVIPNLTRHAASYALIENVITAEHHRRRGYAAALIAHAIRASWDAGCYKVMLLSGSQHPATLRFYENCGFTQDKTGFQIRRP